LSACAGSGDEALADAERTCAAAIQYATAAPLQQVADDAVLLEQLLNGDLDDDAMDGETFGGLGGGGDSLLQMPAEHVAYDAPPQGGLTAATMQLLKEKALLKQQLHQLDSDFQVRYIMLSLDSASC
jgi:hypothetical protein